MENFNEDLLNACDISAFECFSVTETRDRVLKEVESLGDEELSLAYKAFFTEEKEDLSQVLEQLYKENDQLALVRKSLKFENFEWIKRLIKNKRRAINWYVEKIIAETLDPEIISLLLNRQIGWSAQAVIVEQDNSDWTYKLLKKQRDLSYLVQEYVINNANDDCVFELICKDYLAPGIQVSIARKRSINCIKALLSKHADLPQKALISIVELGNKDLTKSLIYRSDLTDEFLIFFAKNADEDVLLEFLKHKRNKLGTFSSLIKEIIINRSNDACVIELIKNNHLAYEAQLSIVEKCSKDCIKALLNHQTIHKDVFVEIFKSGDRDLIKLLASRDNLTDDVIDRHIASFVKNANENDVEEFLGHGRKNLGALTQREIIRSGNPKFIYYVEKQKYRIPDFRSLIIKSLDVTLIKKFVVNIKKLSGEEIDIIKSIGTQEMISLIN